MNSIPALPLVLPFVLGVAVGYFTVVDEWALIIAIILLTIVSIITLRYSRLRIIAPAIAFFVVGVFCMQYQKQKLNVELPNGYASFTAIATDNPQQKKSGLATEFYVLDGAMAGHYVRLYVKNDSASLHYRGQEFQPVVPQLGYTYHIRSRMKPIEGNNSYTFWAQSHSYIAQSWVYPQNIQLVEATLTLPASVRLPLKARLLRSRLLRELFPTTDNGEETAILAAMAFGDKSLITAELRDSYSIAGASHLLALSGMHLGILFSILMLVFGRTETESLYRPGRWSGVVAVFSLLKQVMVIVAVWFYVLLTGMPASVVRAATMITIYAVINAGQQREQMSMNALMLTVMIMLMINPMMLWDIGFQMSVLAMASIFLFYPGLRDSVYLLCNKIIFIITERREARNGKSRLYMTFHLENVPLVGKVMGILLISIAAQLGTAPLALFYFGRISTCFLITNLIAIPIVTILLYCVFIYTALFLLNFSIVNSYLSIVIYFLARVLNTSMETIASWGLFIDGVHINLPQLALIYLALIIIYIMFARVRRMVINKLMNC